MYNQFWHILVMNKIFHRLVVFGARKLQDQDFINLILARPKPRLKAQEQVQGQNQEGLCRNQTSCKLQDEHYKTIVQNVMYICIYESKHV